MFFFKKSNNLRNYGLCSSDYLSTPVLSWDAILNMTKVVLELIPDPDMLLVFEKCMRSRVSYIFKIYSEVNKNI